MKIVIVEDDQNKICQIADVVESEAKGADVRRHRSYQSGLEAIVEWRPDLVILDMSMPTFDVHPGEQGGRDRPYAGREILAEVARRGVPCRVIVVTQFETFKGKSGSVTLAELKGSLGREYAKFYVGTVYYNAAEAGWRSELATLLAAVI